jgi:uncharacterized RDD family membrane protein YckC
MTIKAGSHLSDSLSIPTITGKGFGARAAAYFLDGVIILTSFGICYALVILVVYFLQRLLVGQASFYDNEMLRNFNFLQVHILSRVYFIVFESLHGATPGKLITRMRVVKEDGAACDFKAALIRALLRYIDGLVGGVVAGLCMCATGDTNQRIGDLLARTIVANTDDPGIKEPRTTRRFYTAVTIYVVVQLISISIGLIITWQGPPPIGLSA